MSDLDEHLGRRESLIVDALCAITVAALFSGLSTRIGPVKVQLADALAAVTIFIITIRGYSTPRASGVTMLFLGLYLLVYLLSALSVGFQNGLRESAQLALIFGFAFTVFGHYRSSSTGRLLVLSSWLLFGILAFNIAWHAAQGQFVGWKSLNEPKTIFIILPLLTILCIRRMKLVNPLLIAMICLVLAVIIFLSGERKAYLFAIIALLAYTGVSAYRYLAFAALFVPLVLVLNSFDSTGYLSRQVNSITERIISRDAVDQASLATLLSKDRLATASDTRREITNRVADRLWAENPIFGTGTNAFKAQFDEDQSIPSNFRKGIHGEFQRALVENGIVGFVLYVSFWTAGFVQILRKLANSRGGSSAQSSKIKLLCALMFLIYCAFEASKQLTQFCIVVLPFMLAAPFAFCNATSQDLISAKHSSMRRMPQIRT